MHLYPARLGSALPASVARQSSPPLSFSLSPLSFFPVLSCAPRLISGSSSSFVLPLPLSPAPRNRSTNLRTPRRRKDDVEEEARSYRRRRVPVVRFFSPLFFALSTELHATEKDHVHPAEMHSRFSIRIGDKDVTLLECCDRMRDRFVTLTLFASRSID